MESISMINNTSVYRNPAPQSPLQGQNVMQPAAVYSKIMLRTIELAESDYVFDKLATERKMPSNNGSNEIVFKRMLSLAAHTQPLVEGIPPASDQGRMVAIKASAHSYGRVMKFTDKVDWAVVDPLISEYTRQLALKVPETKDILAQEALLAEGQSFYACEKISEGSGADAVLVPAKFGDVKHIKYLTPDCAPTIDEFRTIVLSMEAAKVRPYSGSNFKVLATSAVLFDLITDNRVKEFMRYTNTGNAYTSNMVIDLFNLAFEKAKTAKSDNTFTDANGNLCYLYHAPNVTLTTTTDITGATYTGPINFVTKAPISEVGNGDGEIEVVPLKRNAAGAYVNAVDKLKGGKGKLDTLTKGAYDALNVHYSFVLGEDCLYRIGVEGHTQPQFIKKEKGSAGTEDPLNQRQSIGWKIDSLGYKVPNPDAVVLYMSCPTQYRVNINARPDLKNQFTDYEYGYMDAKGQYWYPEQVMQTVDGGQVKYYVKGTTTEVNPIKMTKLVQPINSGRIDKNGNRPLTEGTVPSTGFCLKSNPEVRFMDDQVAKHSDGKYYIKNLTGTAAAEVIKLPHMYEKTVIKSDGTGYEKRNVIVEGDDVNKTGDPTVDNK